MIKKILSFLLVLSILFFSVVPAFADDVEYTSTISSFWSDVMAVADEYLDKVPLGKYVVSGMTSIFHPDQICVFADDRLHRCSNPSHIYGRGTDEHGDYVILECDKCGEWFSCYSSDFQNAYDSAVADLPATSIADDGGLIWAPTFADITNDVGFVYVGGLALFHSPYTDAVYSSGNRGASISYSATSYHCVFSDSSTRGIGSSGMKGVDDIIYLTAPIDGAYTRLETCMINGNANVYSNQSGSSARTYLTYWSASSTPFVKAADDSIAVGGWNTGADDIGSYIKYIDFFWHMPQYKIVPTSSTSTTNYYNTGTRVGSLNLNLATTSTVNNVTTIENVYNNTQIVNETNNTIYDPTSGSTYNIADWIYDYLTRTYTGTLEDGSAFSVNYADDLVHIDLGGITLDLSYVTERETDNHTHTYVVAGRTDPTCTQDGSATYTCSVCGLSYSETLPALGHSWRLKETVPATYTIDEATLVCPNCNGTDIAYELVDGGPMYSCTCADCDNTWTVAGSTVSGYDLYECTRCGLTYKDYTGEGVDRSDSAYWAWLQWWLQNFQAWLDGKLDGLEVGGAVYYGDTIYNDYHPYYDYSITYGVDEDGNSKTTSVSQIFNKFSWVKDVWKIARSMVAVVSSDAAYAYEFDYDIGEEIEQSLQDDPDLGLDGNGYIEDDIPSITIELGASTTSWFPGGTVRVLNFSWYTPYKSTVDNILSGFLWLFFVWKLFQKTPGIISGGAMDSSKLDDISRGERRR